MWKISLTAHSHHGVTGVHHSHYKANACRGIVRYHYPHHHDLLFQIRSSLLHFKCSNVSKIERPSDKHSHSRCVSCLFTCVIFSRLFTRSTPLCHGLNEAVTVGRVLIFPPLQVERAKEEICTHHNAKIFASDGPERLSFTNENVFLL